MTNYINGFKIINDINIIVRSNGYVDRDGNFYFVSPKSVHSPSHEEFAKDFIEKNINTLEPNFDKKRIKKKYADYNSLLVHRYGFVAISHSIKADRGTIITFPRDNSKNASKKQIELIETILILSNEYDDYVLNSNGSSYVHGESLNRFLDKDKLGEKIWKN